MTEHLYIEQKITLLINRKDPNPEKYLLYFVLIKVHNR